MCIQYFLRQTFPSTALTTEMEKTCIEVANTCISVRLPFILSWMCCTSLSCTVRSTLPFHSDIIACIYLPHTTSFCNQKMYIVNILSIYTVTTSLPKFNWCIQLLGFSVSSGMLGVCFHQSSSFLTVIL